MFSKENKVKKLKHLKIIKSRNLGDKANQPILQMKIGDMLKMMILLKVIHQIRNWVENKRALINIRIHWRITIFHQKYHKFNCRKIKWIRLILLSKKKSYRHHNLKIKKDYWRNNKNPNSLSYPNNNHSLLRVVIELHWQ